MLEALPKMAEAATASQLKEAFLAHLEETYGHGRRLEEIFNAWGEEPSGETCKAIEGLIQEGEDYVKAGGDSHVRDAGPLAQHSESNITVKATKEKGQELLERGKVVAERVAEGGRARGSPASGPHA